MNRALNCLFVFAFLIGPLAVGQDRATTGSTAVPAVPKAVAWDGLKREAALTDRYVAMLRGKKFDELDAEAARLRKEQSFDNPIWWHIDTFYEAMVSMPGTSEEQRIATLREWVDKRPASDTAKIALAKALSRAATARRGHGTSDTVTKKGWDDFEQLRRETQRLINAASKDAEADSQYWVLRIITDFQLDGADVREIARRAAKRVHTPRVFQTASERLLPKYGGTSAGFLAFLDEAGRLTKPTLGDGLYVFLVPMARTDSADVYFKEIEPKITWERLRQSYRDLITARPGWVPLYHVLAREAKDRNDRSTARELFLKPELQWFEGAEPYWQGRAAYDEARKWALRRE